MSRVAGPRTLRFGGGGWAVAQKSVGEVLDLAQSAEELGYDFFGLPDHLHSDYPTLDPVTTLAWLAGKTSRIKLLSNVLALPYRPPPVLAKMAETLDRVSDGRFILGVGGGAFDHEFRAFGLAQRSGREKVSAQREAITIMREMWSGRAVEVQGVHFAVCGARITPPPTHAIPIWIGSYGPRALALAGAMADGWIPSVGRIGVDRSLELLRTVRDAAVAAGREPEVITYACNVPIGNQGGGGASERYAPRGTAELIGQLTALVDGGFTVFMFSPATVAEQQMLAQEVMPVLRSSEAMQMT